ncbi:MAG: hypothetical protein WD030_10410 [Pirellulales bacterium]
MEADSPTTTSEDRLGDDFLPILREQRAQAEEFLREQQEQLGQLEQELLAVVEELSAELTQEQDEVLAERRAWRSKATDLERQANNLARLEQELAAQQEHWRKLQQLTAEQQQVLLDRTAERRQALDERVAELNERERALDELALGLQQAEQRLKELHQEADASQAAAAEQRQSLERRLGRVQEREAQLDEALQQVEQRAAETRRQRRRLGAEIRGQRDQKGQVRDHAARLEAENERLRSAAGDAGSADVDELLDGLTQEKNELIQRLMAADERIANLERQPSAGGTADAEKLTDLKRRLEMAIEDNRTLKRRNADLEDKVAAGGGKPCDDEAGFDWESQKQRLIASLESDFDSNDSEQHAERLTVEGTIRITDEIVRRKEREIEELKQLLNDQSSNVGNLAVGANAVQEVLNSDELIRQERENLTKLKTEMREKQRQAEVEISLERAKLARMRAEFEEKLSAIEIERARYGGKKGGDAPEEPPRGRWLARLGLKDDDVGDK